MDKLIRSLAVELTFTGQWRRTKDPNEAKWKEPEIEMYRQMNP